MKTETTRRRRIISTAGKLTAITVLWILCAALTVSCGADKGDGAAEKKETVSVNTQEFLSFVDGLPENKLGATIPLNELDELLGGKIYKCTGKFYKIDVVEWHAIGSKKHVVYQTVIEHEGQVKSRIWLSVLVPINDRWSRKRLDSGESVSVRGDYHGATSYYMDDRFVYNLEFEIILDSIHN